MHPLMSVRKKENWTRHRIAYICVCLVYMWVLVCVWERKRFCMYDDAVDDAMYPLMSVPKSSSNTYLFTHTYLFAVSSSRTYFYTHAYLFAVSSSRTYVYTHTYFFVVSSSTASCAEIIVTYILLHAHIFARSIIINRVVGCVVCHNQTWVMVCVRERERFCMYDDAVNCAPVDEHARIIIDCVACQNQTRPHHHIATLYVFVSCVRVCRGVYVYVCVWTYLMSVAKSNLKTSSYCKQICVHVKVCMCIYRCVCACCVYLLTCTWDFKIQIKKPTTTRDQNDAYMQHSLTANVKSTARSWSTQKNRKWKKKGKLRSKLKVGTRKKKTNKTDSYLQHSFITSVRSPVCSHVVNRASCFGAKRNKNHVLEKN